MMYMEKMVVVVKCQGKIMRETNGEISLPFGSEYSLLIKNKEARKAVVNVEIDGKDVLGGKQLIVEPNRETELKGFLDGNIAKNSFKFIQKTKKIADYRGDRIDDGLIRVAFKFEKVVVDVPIVHYEHRWQNHWYGYTPWDVYGEPFLRSSLTSSSNNVIAKCFSSQSSNTMEVEEKTHSIIPKSDEGITVKGSEVNQQFTTGYTKQLEDEEKVIVLVLKGYNDNVGFVEKPIFVQTKKTCPSCGNNYESYRKYCSSDGTFLG